MGTGSQLKEMQSGYKKVGCYVKHGECSLLELFLRGNIRCLAGIDHILGGWIGREACRTDGRSFHYLYSQLLTIRSR